jgi:hypothetical protein
VHSDALDAPSKQLSEPEQLFDSSHETLVTPLSTTLTFEQVLAALHSIQLCAPLGQLFAVIADSEMLTAPFKVVLVQEFVPRHRT